MLNSRSNRGLLAALLFVVSAVTVAAAACGSDNGPSGSNAGAATGGGVAAAPAKQSSSEFQKSRPVAHIYTAEEVVTAGFKKSMDYDVTGLPEATAAIYGFYGTDPYNRKEYELRFYKSHDDAVKYGVQLAEEVVGDNAKLAEGEATWNEGFRERRECQGNVRGSHHVGKCLFPKHYDYAVLGNMVVLCQGHDVAESDQTCEALFKVLPQ